MCGRNDGTIRGWRGALLTPTSPSLRWQGRLSEAPFRAASAEIPTDGSEAVPTGAVGPEYVSGVCRDSHQGVFEKYRSCAIWSRRQPACGRFRNASKLAGLRIPVL